MIIMKNLFLNKNNFNFLVLLKMNILTREIKSEEGIDKRKYLNRERMAL
jgi:hypothetical protein